MMMIMMAMATPMIMRIFMSFHHIFWMRYHMNMVHDVTRSRGAHLANTVGPPTETLCGHGEVVCGSPIVSTARSRSTADPNVGRAASR